MKNINPNKLLNSKWTAVKPVNKEKHFVVTKVQLNRKDQVESCHMVAVMSHREYAVDWQELKQASHWVQGWK